MTTKPEVSTGNQRTNLRMSKLARSIQSTVANMNWNEMAKMLFWGDSDQSRHDEVVRLHSEENLANTETMSYTVEQSQYILVLMLILTVAEKRIQELYQQSFSQRCDSISQTHGLKDDQYWSDGKIPAEWEQLDQEFEQQSIQILIDTLREYSMDSIADHLQTAGPQQFYDIIGSLQPQFLRVLQHPGRGMLQLIARQQGSIPEIVQSSSRKKSTNRG
jgi:hypothetical protein